MMCAATSRPSPRAPTMTIRRWLNPRERIQLSTLRSNARNPRNPIQAVLTQIRAHPREKVSPILVAKAMTIRMATTLAHAMVTSRSSSNSDAPRHAR
jgi:hypothetical protein